MNNPDVNAESYQKLAEMTRVFREAVREAREESRRMGVANVTSINGQIYYELPNGEITREQPAEFKAVDLTPKK
jgi:hypothetical protein